MSNIIHFQMGEIPIGLNPAVAMFDNMEVFPEVGNSQILYIDKSSNLLYYWTGAAYKLFQSANVVCMEEKPTDYAVGGLPAGQVLKGLSWDKILQRMLYIAENPTFKLPKMIFTVDRYLYDMNDPQAVLSITIEWDRGRIIPAYGTDGYYAGKATAFGCNAILGYAVEDKISAVVPVDTTQIETSMVVWVDYAEGAQPTDSHDQPYETAYPAGRASNMLTIYSVPTMYRDMTEEEEKEEIKNEIIEEIPEVDTTNLEDNDVAGEEPGEIVIPAPLPYVAFTVADTLTDDGRGVEFERIEGTDFYLKDFPVAEIQLFDTEENAWTIVDEDDIETEEVEINEEQYTAYRCDLPVQYYPRIRFYVIKPSENEDGNL